MSYYSVRVEQPAGQHFKTFNAEIPESRDAVTWIMGILEDNPAFVTIEINRRCKGYSC